MRFPAKCRLYYNAIGKVCVCVVWRTIQYGISYLNVIEIVQSEGCCVYVCVCIH